MKNVWSNNFITIFIKFLFFELTTKIFGVVYKTLICVLGFLSKLIPNVVRNEKER